MMQSALETSLLNDAEIVYIPLEGTGKILYRVSLFLEMLSSYENELKTSDMVIIVSHSQGTIVAPILFTSLLQKNYLKEDVRVTILAMAGIAHGPFQALKDSVVVKYVERDAAKELFAFHYGPLKSTDQEDEDVQKIYREALDNCLKIGVNVVAVASFLDQVVPVNNSTSSSLG